MRPQSLTPLFAQTTSLPGIGPRLGKLVEKLAGPLVVDLLWHLPFAVVDRRNAPEIVSAMLEFRAGQRPGTVMGRIAKGFTDDEIKAIAAWYAAQKV